MNRRAGFTLVEMIVAMGILVVGVSSILGLLTFGAALQRTAESRNDVALAAAAVIEDLRVNTFPLSADGVVGAPASMSFERDVPGHPKLTAYVDLRESPDREGEYFATVRIGWKERGKRRAETFRTILQREVPFDRRVEAEIKRAKK
ncbi:MAG TPA: prepilin-type N-terminal cleavage/methylation domain-containing protein [Planctomycetota bacterium]|nr:prepilin-type N-terminal cleavage/methylation domain-containing protein [Planctomycetota bacterium]